MLPTAFATQRCLRFLGGPADRQAGREEAQSWEQGCWQAGGLRSMGGARGHEPQEARPGWEKVPAKGTQGDLTLLRGLREGHPRMRNAEAGSPLWAGSVAPRIAVTGHPGEATRSRARHSPIPPAASDPGAGEAGVGEGAGTGSEVSCLHRRAPGTTCSPGHRGRVLPGRRPWKRKAYMRGGQRAGSHRLEGFGGR